MSLSCCKLTHKIDIGDGDGCLKRVIFNFFLKEILLNHALQSCLRIFVTGWSNERFVNNENNHTDGHSTLKYWIFRTISYSQNMHQQTTIQYPIIFAGVLALGDWAIDNAHSLHPPSPLSAGGGGMNLLPNFQKGGHDGTSTLRGGLLEKKG